MAITQSPLSTAANNIITIGTRNQRVLPKAQKEFQDFSRFLEIEIIKLEKQPLPDKRKVKNLADINIVSNFGSVGNLLQNLLGGALDLGGFVSGMFPGKGDKVGKPSSKGKPQPAPSVRGGKLRLGGLRALGIANAVFSGLDFATGLAEGEGVGKAASGALGSFGGAIAGSLLAGAVGQALIPVPGVGFVLGMLGGAAGGFLGGYGADRAYEAVTGGGGQSTQQRQEQQLREAEQKQRGPKNKPKVATQSFSEVLMKFNEAVIKFEDFSMNIGSLMGITTNYEGTNDGGGTINTAPEREVQPYDGPISGETFNPLPGGILSTREVGVAGGEYGANRSYGGHSGQDIGGKPPGAPVVAWKTGRISYIGSVEPGDTILEIDHGGGVKSRYKHVVPTVPNGSIVYGGQQIAKLFATRNYAEHLHFEVWKNGSHVNPMPYIRVAQKLPGPLSPEKARQASLSNRGNQENQEVGVNLQYPQQTQSISQPTQQPRPQTPTTPTPSPRPQSALTPPPAPRPIAQSLPSNVMAAPPRQERQIQSYPSYSQGQSYIMDRETIITLGGSSGRSSSAVIPSGGGGSGSSIVLTAETGSVVLNSLMKSILLTSLSSS